ncbi:hypothetical protein Pelo_18292 [Pelomyxa schiedti]|nr:hypothetical protein Pelo_18292 [Pelomyxa schiedti]
MGNRPFRAVPQTTIPGLWVAPPTIGCAPFSPPFLCRNSPRGVCWVTLATSVEQALDVKKHHVTRICVFGDPGVGVKSFCSRFSGENKTILKDVRRFSDRPDGLDPFKKAKFGLLFFDVSNTGENLVLWIGEFERWFSPPDSELIFVGNKNDLVPHIPPNLQALFDRGIYKVFYISVHTGAGLQELWDYIHLKIVMEPFETDDDDGPSFVEARDLERVTTTITEGLTTAKSQMMALCCARRVKRTGKSEATPAVVLWAQSPALVKMLAEEWVLRAERNVLFRLQPNRGETDSHDYLFVRVSPTRGVVQHCCFSCEIGGHCGCRVLAFAKSIRFPSEKGAAHPISRVEDQPCGIPHFNDHAYNIQHWGNFVLNP